MATAIGHLNVGRQPPPVKPDARSFRPLRIASRHPAARVALPASWRRAVIAALGSRQCERFSAPLGRRGQFRTTADQSSQLSGPVTLRHPWWCSPPGRQGASLRSAPAWRG